MEADVQDAFTHRQHDGFLQGCVVRWAISTGLEEAPPPASPMVSTRSSSWTEKAHTRPAGNTNKHTHRHTHSYLEFLKNASDIKAGSNTCLHVRDFTAGVGRMQTKLTWKMTSSICPQLIFFSSFSTSGS